MISCQFDSRLLLLVVNTAKHYTLPIESGAGMPQLSTVLYQSVSDADGFKRRMWVWIWERLLEGCSKSELRKMLQAVEVTALKMDDEQVLAQLAFKAEVIEKLLEA